MLVERQISQMKAIIIFMFILNKIETKYLLLHTVITKTTEVAKSPEPKICVTVL